MPTSLPAALARQAAADPESPFLFWPEGWNWRWWSWRQVAELTARWSAPLAGLRAGAGVAFAGDTYPQAIVLDLAVQAAGLTAMPVAGGGGAAGQDLDAGAARQAAAQAGAVAWLEAAAGEARAIRLDGAAAAELENAAGAGPGVLVADGGGGWRRLSPATVLAAARRVEGAIAAGRGEGAIAAGQVEGAVAAGRAEGAITAGWGEGAIAAGQVEGAIAAGRAEGAIAAAEREILVAGWPLREWPGRVLAAWAVFAGAALVLEADPARRLGTVRWARPTVFHGSAAEVAALRSHVEAARQPHRWRGWRRLPAPPLGRLRTLFQLGPPAPAEVAFWQARGARLLALPGPGDADLG